MTVAEKVSTCSLIDVHPELIQHIPENDHLLFCSSGWKEVNLPFIQQNHNWWWEQQKTNSWTFYLSPQFVAMGSWHVLSFDRTIAHIMIFLQTPTCLQLHLLYHWDGDGMELLIQEEGKELQVVHTAETSARQQMNRVYVTHAPFITYLYNPEWFHREHRQSHIMLWTYGCMNHMSGLYIYMH